ncbi:SRPBCC family protein [Zavarzinia compransoris]|nr:carbon monoxide dehydrogenase subunit G [Zavarzinia compransoris]
MTGAQRINASQQAVWTALNDVDVLKQCIPGCEQIARVSPTDLEALVVLRVGPVKASFKGAVKLSDIDPPNGYTIKGEGNGGSSGQAKGGARVWLTRDGRYTVLNYDVNAEVTGKLAQLGARLIDATAKKLADDFFQKLGDIVAPPTNEILAEREARQWIVIRVIKRVVRAIRRLFGGGGDAADRPAG